MSQPIRGQGGHFGFPIHKKNTNLVEDVKILLPVEFRSVAAEEKSKMYQSFRDRAAILVFRSLRNYTNFVEDVEILLPVKFCKIPFSGIRKEVENVSANPKPDGHLGFPIRNIATNVASMFTRTCQLFSIVVTSSKYVGNFGHRTNLTWSFEQVFLRFTDSSKSSQFVN